MKITTLRITGVTYADDRMTVHIDAQLMNSDGRIFSVSDIIKVPVYQQTSEWSAVFTTLGELYQRFPAV